MTHIYPKPLYPEHRRPQKISQTPRYLRYNPMVVLRGRHAGKEWHLTPNTKYILLSLPLFHIHLTPPSFPQLKSSVLASRHCWRGSRSAVDGFW